MNDIMCSSITLNSSQSIKKHGNYNNEFIYALE
jgi:hypothetical protein